MVLSDEQRALLAAELDPHLAARMAPSGKGEKVSYLEAYVVIDQANRVFGFGQWGYRLVKEDRDVDPETGAGVYSAWVEVTVTGCEPVVELGDCMLLVGQGKTANAAQKSMARKGAVTDGLKRGLRHFGNQFGNSLYARDSDIHQAIEQAEQEERAERAGRTGQAALRPRPSGAAIMPAAEDDKAEHRRLNAEIGVLCHTLLRPEPASFDDLVALGRAYGLPDPVKPAPLSWKHELVTRLEMAVTQQQPDAAAWSAWAEPSARETGAALSPAMDSAALLRQHGAAIGAARTADAAAGALDSARVDHEEGRLLEPDYRALVDQARQRQAALAR